MTTTALQIITEALGIVGVASPGQDIEADDSDLGLRLLNELLDSWALSRLYSAAETHAVYTPPAGIVTAVRIGPGLDIDTPRPVRFAAGFLRRGNYDHPFDVIDRASFDRLGYKGGFAQAPSVAWYDGRDTITFAPPFAGGELHIPVEGGLAEFEALSTAQALPQGYRKALALTLAEEMAPHYSRDLSARTVQRAMNARRAIRRANLVVPTLRSYLPQPSPLFAGAFDASTGFGGSAPAPGAGGEDLITEAGESLLSEDGFALAIESAAVGAELLTEDGAATLATEAAELLILES